MLLELVEGPSLRDHLKATGRLAWDEVARLGADLAGALVAVHAAGLVHCDVKPKNVLVGRDRYVLIDFDLARPPGLVGPGRGTRLWAAPEQARGGLIGPPADAWGLGAVLFRAATGEGAFQAKEGQPQITERAPSVGSRRLDGGHVAEIIDALLHPDPEQRPALTWVADRLRLR